MSASTNRGEYIKDHGEIFTTITTDQKCLRVNPATG